MPGPSQHGDTWEAISTLSISVLVTFSLAAITLLKGKIWTGLFGLVPVPAAHRGRHPAGPARLTLGPVALPAPPA